MSEFGFRRFGQVPVRLVGLATTLLLVLGLVAVGPASAANASASVNEIPHAGPAVAASQASLPVLSDSVTLSHYEVLYSSFLTDGGFGYFGTGGRFGLSSGERARLVKVRLSDMTRVGELTLDPDEGNLTSAITDGEFGFFATQGNQVLKVRLSDMTRVGAVTLNADEAGVRSAVTDGQFGYFGTTWLGDSSGLTGRVVKVRLSDMTRVGAVTLNSGENLLVTAVTDGEFGYFGSGGTTDKDAAPKPVWVVKVRLSDMIRVGKLSVNGGEARLLSATTDGVFGYFGTEGSPASVLKIRLSNMTQVSSLTLDAGENFLRSAVTDGEFGYFGTVNADYGSSLSPGLVVKVRLSDMTRIGAVELNRGEDFLVSAVIAGEFGYFGSNSGSSDLSNTGPWNRNLPSGIVKIRLSDMTRVGSVTLGITDEFLDASVTDGEFVYFGTDTSPGRVIKVRLSDMTRVGAVTLNPDENFLHSAVTDGEFGYFGSSGTERSYLTGSISNLPTVVKIRLSDMTRVGSVVLNAGFQNLKAAVTDGVFGYFVDGYGIVVKIRLSDMTLVGFWGNSGRGLAPLAVTDGLFGYFVQGTSAPFQPPSGAEVVKIRLSDMTPVGEAALQANESFLTTAVADGDFAYFGSGELPARVVKVRLSDMTRVGAVTLNFNETRLKSAVTDGEFGYFAASGRDFSPDSLVKVRLSDLTRVGAVTLDPSGFTPSAVSDGEFGYFGIYPALGPPAQLMKFRLDPPTLPGAPASVTAVPKDSEVSVSWTAPVDDGGSQIMGYRVTATPGGASCSTVSVGQGAPATSCVVKSLINGAGYSFTVVATNDVGDSLASPPSSEVNPFTVPGVASSVRGVAGDGRISVTWSRPGNDGGSPVTGYQVTATPGGASCSTVSIDQGAPATSCDVTGLTNGVGYTFTVVASNAAGSGMMSEPSISVSPRTVPGIPTGVSGQAGNGQVAVSWSAPASDGGSPVTGYVATSSPGALTCSTTAVGSIPAPTSCVIEGLTNGTGYTFSVVGSNVAGVGRMSEPSNSVSPLPVPGTSTDVSGLPGNGLVEVSWIAPIVGISDAPATGYLVTGSPRGSCEVVAPETSCVVAGLSNGTEYTFTVVALNLAGFGLASGPSTPVTPRTVPGVPTEVLVVPDTGEVVVSWATPTIDGGSPVTGYVVTGTPAGSCEVAAPATSCRVQLSAERGSYQFFVAALNVAGTSELSLPSVKVTPGAGSADPEFSDVPAGSFFVRATSMLKLRGITEGTNPAGDVYSPQRPVNRQQMALFLWRMAGSPDGPASCGFADEASIGVAARVAACWLKAEDITTNNPYDPTGVVNRQQMAAFLWRFAGEPSAQASCGFTDEAAISTFARVPACWLKATDITTNNPYRPTGDVTRAQMAAFLYRLGAKLDLWVRIDD